MRALLAALLLAGCGGLPVPLGPNVAANVQAGAENVQGQKVENAPSIVRPRAREIRQEQSENRLRADRVDTVIVNVIPPWIVLVALIGWIAPSPGEIARRVREAVTRRRATVRSTYLSLKANEAALDAPSSEGYARLSLARTSS